MLGMLFLSIAITELHSKLYYQLTLLEHWAYSQCFMLSSSTSTSSISWTSSQVQLDLGKIYFNMKKKLKLIDLLDSPASTINVIAVMPVICFAYQVSLP